MFDQCPIIEEGRRKLGKPKSARALNFPGALRLAVSGLHFMKPHRIRQVTPRSWMLLLLPVLLAFTGPAQALREHEAIIPLPESSVDGFPELRIPDKSPSGKKTLIPVNERQGQAVFYEEILESSGAKQAGIVISLSRQRVYLLLGTELAIDSPIASGRKPGWTPKGRFRIMEKDPNHRSNRYGDLVDEDGRVVRRNVTCGASGGIFRGASMKWFLRLNEEGVGMHAGILPGYPASHGCIRLPGEVAARMYRIVTTGTPVLVTD
jgi:lipoprotein-anchoring transpeptidase ErfK/SrfK